MVIAWLLALITVGYMLPWAVAATRGKSNHGAIAVLDLFLGWSLIGWIIALVMACQAHQAVGAGVSTTVIVAPQFQNAQGGRPAPQVPLTPGPGWYPSPCGIGQQYWDGTMWTEHRAP